MVYHYFQSLKKSSKFLFGLIFVLIINIPYIILGENSFINIHDNLDSEHVYLHLLKINNHLFCINPHHTIDKLMYDGFKVSNIHSSLNFINLYYYIFPSYWAYIINLILVKLIGFVGFYSLMKKINNSIFPILLSLIFSTLPIFPIHGIMVMGIPFLVLSILNIQSKKHLIWSYLFLIFYSFYSNFFLGGFFVILSFPILIFFTRKLSLLKPFLVLLVSNIVFNYPFIYNFITNESHRSEFNLKPEFLNRLYEYIVFGNYHFATFIFIIPFILLINKKIFFKNIKLILLYFLIGFLSSLLEYYNPIGFNISRINIYLIPIGFLILINITSLLGNSTKTITVLLLTITINLFNNQDLRGNMKNLIPLKFYKSLKEDINQLVLNKKEPFVSISKFGFFGSDGLISKNSFRISYKSYFCEDVFSIIKKKLDIDKSRVLNIGLSPSISQYNDLYTPDGYFNFYSLKHKHNFRKLIEDELNLNNERKKYYDGWGSRVYFFSSNLDKTCGMNCFNDSDYQKDGLKIFFSPKTALDLGIDYVFSSLMISNYLNLDLDFIDVYSSDNCNYSIYVYKINHTPQNSSPTYHKLFQ